MRYSWRKSFSQEEVVGVMCNLKKFKLHMRVMLVETSQSLLWMLRLVGVGLLNLVLIVMRTWFKIRIEKVLRKKHLSLMHFASQVRECKI
jgi:hypothetical protein